MFFIILLTYEQFFAVLISERNFGFLSKKIAFDGLNKVVLHDQKYLNLNFHQGVFVIHGVSDIFYNTINIRTFFLPF